MLKHLVTHKNYEVYLNEESSKGWKNQYEIHRRLLWGGTIKEGTVSSYPAALQAVRELNFALEHFTKALTGDAVAEDAVDFIDLLAEGDDDRTH